jgi:hypothetical protein
MWRSHPRWTASRRISRRVSARIWAILVASEDVVAWPPSAVVARGVVVSSRSFSDRYLMRSA